MDLSHLKRQCICCEKTDKKTSKEHIFAEWLLRKTNNFDNTINWVDNKEIPGKNCTIPICEDCNSKLGAKLEGPTSEIFDRIERGMGFNDLEAEILVRWMWKLNGMFYWMVLGQTGKYSVITLHDRVLTPITPPRDRITLVTSLIKDSKEDFDHYPIGLDVFPSFSNVLAAGVFSKLVIIVVYTKHSNLIQDNIYTKYKLSNVPILMNPCKKTYPITGFKTGTRAISEVKILANNILLKPHEIDAIKSLEDHGLISKKD